MKRTAEFTGESPEELARFILDRRQDFKAYRRVIIQPDLTLIQDLNRNEIRFPGIGYGHPLLETLLREAGASFDPRTVHEPPPNAGQRRELPCSARYAWGHDRIA